MSDPNLAQWAAILGVLVVLATLGYWVRGVVRVTLPRDVTPTRAALIAGALLCAISLVVGPGMGTLLTALATTALVLAGSFLALDRISALPQPIPHMKVGQPAPVFSAPTAGGSTFDLAAQAGHPVLLKFFRGHW